MIITQKNYLSNLRSQISDIWLRLPPANVNTDVRESHKEITPQQRQRVLRDLSEFHEQFLDVVRFFLNPRDPHISKSLYTPFPTTLVFNSTENESIFSTKNSNDLFLSSPITLTSDSWEFGCFWPYIQQCFRTSENLYENIRLRQNEIHEILEAIRPNIQQNTELTHCLNNGTISLNPNGISGSYILSNQEDLPKFIVKPLDEDIGAINNPKGYASPFLSSPLLPGVPLYRSCFREVLAYEIAHIIGVSSIVPPTSLAIIQKEQFFDFSQNVRPTELQKYLDHLVLKDKVKLCSVQEFVLESKTLFEALQDLQSASLLDEEIEGLIDPKDFEETNILLWITGDSDAHLENFLITPKRVDAIGNQVFGLRKIDNGLAFPELNGHLNNGLVHLPNAKNSLSHSSIDKIMALNPNQLADILTKAGLESSIPAMRERIESLQNIVSKHPSMSIKSINKKVVKAHEKLV